jgi:hypothetical protein
MVARSGRIDGDPDVRTNAGPGLDISQPDQGFLSTIHGRDGR